MDLDLRASLLNPTSYARLKVHPMTAELCVKQNLGIYPQWAGYQLPYFNLKGLPTGFFRYKFLQHKATRGFAALVLPSKAPPKYGQPKGSGCAVYMPPLLDTPWAVVARDPSQSLVITEGEKKAACGTMLGVPTLGLGGVWNFTSSAAGQELIPDLEQFVWLGRNVVICFDSDVRYKPEVNAALNRLAAILTNRGAIVAVVYVPAADKDAKQGLDDYLAGHENSDKLEAYRELLSRAEEVEAGAMLRRLKATVAFIVATSEVVTLETGIIHRHGDFVSAAYRNWTYALRSMRKDGTEGLTTKYAAAEFMQDPHRTEVARIEYLPGLPSQIVEHSGERVYNAWPGWACSPSKVGTIKPWEDLLDFLLQEATPQERQWLRRWFAYPVRHPGTKLYSAVLVWSPEQGSGKTLLGETMKYIYGANYRKIDSRELANSFNEWARHRQFVLGDEISIGDKRADSDNLKNMITGSEITINSKGLRQYTVKDCINYYFTSNHPDAVFLEDRDRRFFIQESPSEKREKAFYDGYMKWLEADGGAARLLHYFTEEIDLGDFDPTAEAPATRSKQRMIMDGKSDIAMRVTQLKEDCATGRGDYHLPFTLATSAEILRKLYAGHDPATLPVKVNGLARALRAHGFKQAYHGDPVQVEDYGGLRLWVMRGETKKWATATRAAIAGLYRMEHAEAKFKVNGKAIDVRQRRAN